MSTYLYELPTTGAISFADFCLDNTNLYTTSIADATQARANLRAALKESKRTDGEKDYLKLVKVLDDYLPHLYGIMACVDAGEISLTSEPVFSWRSTLSETLFNTSPRQPVHSLHADLAFSLLTYAFALSNLARATVSALGAYEHARAVSDTERQAKDARLNFAVMLLCRASGVFHHLSERVIPEWDKASPGPSRPPDVTREVTSALSKMALADAQTLAVRKLLSKAAYDGTLAPGPPLPKSHPAPALIAKLVLECAAQYAAARALAKTPGSAAASPGAGRRGDADDVAPALRRYLADEARFCGALARKWLGVDAGEGGGAAKGGEAVAFLMWAREELEELKDGGKGIALGAGKEKRERRKEKVHEELESVNVFLRSYKNINDSLHFQPVPPTSELQALIPAGRSAVSVKPFIPPTPAFGPGSLEHTRRQAESLELDGPPDNSNDTNKAVVDGSTANYAGAGSYF